MDVSKIKIGRWYTYGTPTGVESRRGKVLHISPKTPSGPWVMVEDKTSGRTLSVRPGRVER